MAVKKLRDGRYLIRTEKDAIAAAEMGRDLKDAIHEDMVDATQLVKGAAEFFANKHGMDSSLDAPKVEFQLDDGTNVTVVQRFSRFWVGNKSEMPSPKPEGARALRQICGKRKIKHEGKTISLWNFLTKRVPDADAIELAINLGYVDEEEVGAAFIEKPQSPYLNFGKGNSNGD